MAAACIKFMCPAIFLTLAVVGLEAGGWAVITVTHLPDYVVVGRPITLTYAVRQHGRQLLGGLGGRIEARNGSEVVRAAAIPASEPGHYSAVLTLPHAGDWTVDILTGFSGTLNSSRLALPAIDPSRPAPAISDTERGQRLFVSKGCITCHVHGAVEGRTVLVGPALTAKQYEPQYLEQFLAHPRQAERLEAGRWQMPDLNLREGEIASLVAFINARSPRSHQP